MTLRQGAPASTEPVYARFAPSWTSLMAIVLWRNFESLFIFSLVLGRVYGEQWRDSPL